NVQLIEGKEGDYDEHRARVAAQRVSSASAWYEALGAGGLLDAAERVADAGALGEALATSGVIADESEEHAFLTRAFDGMSADVPALPRHVLAEAFLRGRGNAVGVEHTLALLASSTEWNPVARAVALLTLPATATTWEHVEALPPEGQAYYWQHLFAFRVESHEAAVALDALARFERPHAALDLAAHVLAREARDAAEQRDVTSLDAVQAEVADGMSRPIAEMLAHANDADTAGRGGISVQHVADLLERAATVERDVTGQRLDGYDLARLLATLRAAGASEVSRERVVRIEWLWLPSMDYGSEPAALNQYLSRHPAFFAQLVASVYQSDAVSGGAAADEDTAHAVARFGAAPFPIDGGRAYRLLERARFRPSADNAANDGLLAWATEARRMLTEQGYARAGELALGRLLARGTSGTDAAWPAEPVRDLVEQFASKDFEVGIEIGRLNGRGVVTKHPLDGGEQERGLGAFYRAAAERVAARWPRTAAMLCRLAETYARDANREDSDAEFRHDTEW
ncbi:MAG: hypothetical protein IT353_17240, partial [Gemmatimonadaceae bacterium]|nr:hypothetical protein [Gemmatimonadaceae bacterium]